MGPSLVNIFLKTPFFEIVFFQYLQPQAKFHQMLYHEMYATGWIPFWLCWVLLYAEGMQVYYDMVVWNAKKFGYKIFVKNNEADQFIRSWREWYSQHYKGCKPEKFEERKVEEEEGKVEEERKVAELALQKKDEVICRE